MAERMHVWTPTVSYGKEWQKTNQQMLAIKPIKDDNAPQPLQIKMIAYSSAILKNAFYIYVNYGCASVPQSVFSSSL